MVKVPLMAINSMAPPPEPDLLLNKTVPIKRKRNAMFTNLKLSLEHVKFNLLFLNL